MAPQSQDSQAETAAGASGRVGKPEQITEGFMWTTLTVKTSQAN